MWQILNFYCITECSKHCSLCYNATECYECTQGYFLDAVGICNSKQTLNGVK